MPKLWNDTIRTHREAVRDAIFNATWMLVKESGLASVSMSQIAARAGIGRATLYKYYADVEAILAAWHQRHVAEHLEQLTALAAGTGQAEVRLQSVLQAYARIVRNRARHGAELLSLLHRGGVHEAQRQLFDLTRGLIAEMAQAGSARGDPPPDELAAYCLHAIGAAGALPSDAAAERLVRVTMAGLRPD